MTFRDQSLKSLFSIKKMPYGIYPIAGAITFALSGMTYVAYKSLFGPEIGLTKHERQPFYVNYRNNANKDKSTKLYNVNPYLHK